MILVAGGSGLLGTRVVRHLLERRERVRVLTREAVRAEHLRNDGAEIVIGDVRDTGSLPAALAGIQTIVSAIHGFSGPDGVSPTTVDHLGNRNLVRAAEAAGVSDFVLMSVVGAAPEHPMELFRMKYRAEQVLRESSLSWTIIRATAYMELWAHLVGVPILARGKTMVFGRGDNPINFVSVRDVSRFVELAVFDPSLRGEVIDVGGPADLTFNQVVEIFESAAGASSSVSHVPLPLMRLASLLMRPLKPSLARQIRAGVVMDTQDLRFDGLEARRDYPLIPFTTLAEVARSTVTRDRAA